MDGAEDSAVTPRREAQGRLSRIVDPQNGKIANAQRDPG